MAPKRHFAVFPAAPECRPAPQPNLNSLIFPRIAFQKGTDNFIKSPMIITCKALRVDSKSIDLRMIIADCRNKKGEDDLRPFLMLLAGCGVNV